MLRWICGHTRLDRARNDDIRDWLGVASIEKKTDPRRPWSGLPVQVPNKARALFNMAVMKILYSGKIDGSTVRP
jgi:hypothetical protein